MSDFPNLDVKMHGALFRVTDDMRRLKFNPDSITKGEYERILRELCGALTESFQHGLQQAVYYPQQGANDPQMIEPARQIVAEMGLFAEFIALEKRVLIACGVGERTAADILGQISELREHYRADTYNADQIWHCAVSLRDGTCKAAEHVGTHLKGAEQSFEDRRRTMRTYGTALVVANGSAMAVTLGASAPMSFLSSGFGGLLLTWTGFMESPRNKKFR